MLARFRGTYNLAGFQVGTLLLAGIAVMLVGFPLCLIGHVQHGNRNVTVFLTHMKKDFPIYNRLYAEYFAGPGKPNPTRTTVEVTALPTPIAIELKVIAATG